MNEAAFRQMVEAHDLTFCFSDDYRAVKRGRAEYDAIVAAAKALPREVAVRVWNDNAQAKLLPDVAPGFMWREAAEVQS